MEKQCSHTVWPYLGNCLDSKVLWKSKNPSVHHSRAGLCFIVACLYVPMMDSGLSWGQGNLLPLGNGCKHRQCQADIINHSVEEWGERLAVHSHSHSHTFWRSSFSRRDAEPGQLQIVEYPRSIAQIYFFLVRMVSVVFFGIFSCNVLYRIFHMTFVQFQSSRILALLIWPVQHMSESSLALKYLSLSVPLTSKLYTICDSVSNTQASLHTEWNISTHKRRKQIREGFYLSICIFPLWNSKSELKSWFLNMMHTAVNKPFGMLLESTTRCMKTIHKRAYSPWNVRC